MNTGLQLGEDLPSEELQMVPQLAIIVVHIIHILHLDTFQFIICPILALITLMCCLFKVFFQLSVAFWSRYLDAPLVLYSFLTTNGRALSLSLSRGKNKKGLMHCGPGTLNQPRASSWPLDYTFFLRHWSQVTILLVWMDPSTIQKILQKTGF